MKLIDKDALVAEIERRIKEHHSGYLVCLKDILCFIDTLEVKKISSLQEEPVSEDFEMALVEMIDKAQKCVVEPWVVAAQWKDELVKLAKGEEPVSEELEQAAVEAFKQIVDSDKNSFLEIFKAGAEWGRNQAMAEIQAQSMAIAHGCPKEEPVSNDLQSEIDYLAKRYPEVSFAKLSRIAVHVAQWKEQQIIDKFSEWCQEEFYIHPHDSNVVQYVSEKSLEDIDDFLEEFKKTLVRTL